MNDTPWTVRSKILDKIELFSARLFTETFPACASIAVVGNGPLTDVCAYDASRCSVRVRMNDWSNRFKTNKVHMSVSCDVLWNNTSSHWNTYEQMTPRPRIVVFQHNQVTGQRHRQDFMIDVMERHYASIERFCVVNLYLGWLFAEETKCLKPTAGLSALWWINHLFPSMPKYLCGFNWEKGRADRLYNHHEWDAERAWVRETVLGAATWTLSPVCQDALQ